MLCDAWWDTLLGLGDTTLLFYTTKIGIAVWALEACKRRCSHLQHPSSCAITLATTLSEIWPVPWNNSHMDQGDCCHGYIYHPCTKVHVQFYIYSRYKSMGNNFQLSPVFLYVRTHPYIIFSGACRSLLVLFFTTHDLPLARRTWQRSLNILVISQVVDWTIIRQNALVKFSFRLLSFYILLVFQVSRWMTWVAYMDSCSTNNQFNSKFKSCKDGLYEDFSLCTSSLRNVAHI